MGEESLRLYPLGTYKLSRLSARLQITSIKLAQGSMVAFNSPFLPFLIGNKKVVLKITKRDTIQYNRTRNRPDLDHTNKTKTKTLEINTPLHKHPIPIQIAQFSLPTYTTVNHDMGIESRKRDNKDGKLSQRPPNWLLQLIPKLFFSNTWSTKPQVNWSF